MPAVCFRPVLRDGDEVSDIVGYKRSFLACGRCELLGIVETARPFVAWLDDTLNIEALPAELPRDLGGNHLIQPQPHLTTFGSPDRFDVGVKTLPFFPRPLVFRQQRVNLIPVSGRIPNGGVELPW